MSPSLENPISIEQLVQLEKLREDLRCSEARFRNIVHRLPEGVVILDALGAVHFANPAALHLMSQPPNAFFHEFNWRLDIGKTVIYETKTSGVNVVYEMSILETEWDFKKAFLITLRDITQQKSRELGLQQAIDDAESRTAELEIMRFVADQLNQAAMLEETIQSGLEMIQALSGAKRVWALLSEENAAPRLVVVDRQMQDQLPRQATLDLPETCTCLKKLQNGELIEATRMTHCEWAAHIFGLQHAGDQHYSFPLTSGPKTIGVLNLAVEPDKEYSQSEITLLETVSRELAVAIERGRILSETSDALHRDEGVNSITRSLSGALELTTVLQSVVRLSSDLIGAEVGLLSLLSQDHSTLTFPFNFGLPAGMELPSLPQKDCLIWNTAVKSIPALQYNLPDSLPELPADIASRVNSVLSVPIVGNDRCLGVLSLYKTSHERSFTKFDLAMLESLGRQAGLAIVNAELYFEVQQLTTSDALTGLNNRLTFNNLAVKEVERSWRYGRPLTLIWVDVDSLQTLNDQYGMEAGDNIMRVLAHICSFGLRRVDIIARYQNDEIILLLPETDLKNGVDVAERLRLQAATTPIATGNGTTAITVSMGVTGVEGRQEIDLQTLLDRAETALFDAKQAGRNRVSVWTRE
jgi:diguanylate cyclase (GGDEF)-like protein